MKNYQTGISIIISTLTIIVSYLFFSQYASLSRALIISAFLGVLMYLVTTLLKKEMYEGDKITSWVIIGFFITLLLFGLIFGTNFNSSSANNPFMFLRYR